MKILWALLATTILAGAAYADVPPSAPAPPASEKLDAHEPIAGKPDPRIRTFPFNPGQTMRATATGLTPLRLVLAPGEVPVTEAGPLVSNDPKAAKDWFVTSFANTIILQPLHKDIPVSFVFITGALDGEAHNYTVELHTREGRIDDPTDTLAYVQVQFTYPKPPDSKSAARVQDAIRMRTAQAINTRLTEARYNAPRYWHYLKHGDGCAKLTPANKNWLSDDGHQTTAMIFGHQSAPVFNTTDDQGEPQLITPTPISHRSGTLYILPRTYETFEMRRGLLVCELEPDPKFPRDPNGTVTGNGSGTISPDVLLRVRQTTK